MVWLDVEIKEGSDDIKVLTIGALERGKGRKRLPNVECGVLSPRYRVPEANIDDERRFFA